MSVKKRIRKILRDNTMILLSKISPELAMNLIHKRYTGEWLNLKNPQTFDEKINWLSLNGPVEKMAKCSDKIAVHDYLKEKGLQYLSNEILLVTEDPKTINWEKLPNRFVIKTNNASKTNIIVRDKSTLDIGKVNYKLEQWMKNNFGSANAEYHYDNIKPRILIEKYIDFKDDKPIDYKFFCFNGQPYFVYVIKDRDDYGYNFTRAIYDLNWKRIFIQNEFSEHDRLIHFDRPEYLEEMIEYAKILSRDFSFVRVDFYEIEDKVLFGEMTFTPRGGNNEIFSLGVQHMLGDLIDIKEFN